MWAAAPVSHRRRDPFARVAGQTVQQQRRRPLAAEVQPRQTDIAAQ
jgi:hypothetical protein